MHFEEYLKITSIEKCPDFQPANYIATSNIIFAFVYQPVVYIFISSGLVISQIG